MFSFLYHRQHFTDLTIYMSNTMSFLKERERLTLRAHLSSPTGFGWVFLRAPEFTHWSWLGLSSCTWVHPLVLVGSFFVHLSSPTGIGWVFRRAPEFTHWYWLGLSSCTWVHLLVLVGSFFVIFLVFCAVL